MPKKPPVVEVLPKSTRTLDDIAATVDVMNVQLSALLAEMMLVNPGAKQRMLASLQAIRAQATGMPANLKVAYDRAIDIIQSMRTIG